MELEAIFTAVTKTTMFNLRVFVSDQEIIVGIFLKQKKGKDSRFIMANLDGEAMTKETAQSGSKRS